ncbi:unnamed protein product [Brachionus calyciflorus]|uniref:Calponin-homology (CH) domain-containing protein n=1 Tax=Brachionus calyciflorus TaxID=104777 RepID=A0A814MS01_9BILA|nr:unnamed protein product [Brachionus calyciflorus]
MSLTAQVNAKMAGKRDPKLDKEAQEWIEAILGEKFPSNYEDSLKDGIILCKLMNKLRPGAVAKITTKGGGFALRENVSNFCAAAAKYGVPDSELFQTVDLFEKKNIPQVTLAIHALGRYAQKNGFQGPTLGVKLAEENRREFTEEQLRAGEAVIGLQAGFNKGANQSGVSFGTSRHM